MKRISILILFLFTNLIVHYANAKLVYNCKSVHLLGKKYKDVNVVFMTGYELLENMKDNEQAIVKVKKYAIVLVEDSDMIIVELDEPKEENNNVQSMGDIASQADSFYAEYKTNCRLEFTKSCLKDLGNTILYGRELENQYIVTISPNLFI